MKNCIETLSPSIILLVNQSISTGTVSTIWKPSVVTPRLKQIGLDENVPSNFRPVSNLPFLSKVLERVILHQLVAHLLSRPSCLQSAYRKEHSTETAVLKVFSDNVDDMDKGKFVLLSLLDLSVAFDTVDHEILLHRMSTSFRVSGDVLLCASYLIGRS